MFNSHWYPHSPKLAFFLRPREIGHWFLRLKCRESDGCRFSGPHRPHVFGTLGRGCKNHWKKPLEKPLEKKTLGKNFGKSFKNPWKRIAKALKTGKLLGNPLETHWKVLENPWKPIGNPFEKMRQVLGKPLEILRTGHTLLKTKHCTTIFAVYCWYMAHLGHTLEITITHPYLSIFAVSSIPCWFLLEYLCVCGCAHFWAAVIWKLC